MQHVTGLDQMFLSYDTMTTNGNIGGICIFDDDGRGDTPGARLAWLRERVAERLPTLPPLRWRLAPFGMDTFWVESTVDVDYHVVEATLQEPRDEKMLLTYLKSKLSSTSGTVPRLTECRSPKEGPGAVVKLLVTSRWSKRTMRLWKSTKKMTCWKSLPKKTWLS